MFLSTCLLALLPGAGSASALPPVTVADGGKLLFVLMGQSDGNPRGDKPWVCVWDLTKPELKAVVSGLPAGTRSIHPTADGKRFVLVGGNRWHVSHVEVWDVADKKRLREFDVPAKESSITTVSPDGNWVAFRPLTNKADKAEVRVWNTDTGKRAGEVAKAATGIKGELAFSTDSKRLIVTSETEYGEYDLTNGKKASGWKREEPPHLYRESGGDVAVLPDGKGIVLVSPTAKRRPSYVILLRTEKKDWHLGEFWDSASAPALSPDGRLLIVSGGRPNDGGGTFVLKLDADGTPEMEDRVERDRPLFGGGDGKKVPAWREWQLGEVLRGRFDLKGDWPRSVAFSEDGKRVFVGGTLGRVHVHDAERREQNATLFAAEPKKDSLPEWHILTVGGEFVASPAETEALTTKGKKKDVAKVKEALGRR